MAAPKGNKYWGNRTAHGRKKDFETPDQLWNAAIKYFKANAEDPIIVQETVKFQGQGTTMEVQRERPLTIDKLCLNLDISYQTWLNYKAREDFFEVTDAIERTIRSQKLEGAMVGIFNGNIVARDIGLADNQNVNATVNPHEEWLKQMAAKKAAADQGN